MSKSKEKYILLLRRYILTFILALISCAGTNYIHCLMTEGSTQNSEEIKSKYENENNKTVEVEALYKTNQSIDLI